MNRKNDLLECITSIQEIDYPENKIELIIWDNGSIDGTKAEVSQIFKGMEKEDLKMLDMIQSEENLGVYTSRDGVLY